MFFQMISRLSELSDTAEPTPFHHILRRLDKEKKLLRVYTQNIDSLESKAGLSFGVSSRSSTSSSSSQGRTPPSQSHRDLSEAGPSSKPTLPKDDRRQPSPPAEIPRCVPLHGTLQTLHCQICLQSFPLQPHLPSLAAGTPPPCPNCSASEANRRADGKRARSIGLLRPSVVLYNEAHRDGEGVGEIVQKDLMSVKKKPDLVLVVGTSLRVPGTKRMVREFAKAVKKDKKDEDDEDRENEDDKGKGKAKEKEKEDLPRRIYLNLDFPVPTRDWENVFDVWVQGDAQRFAELLRNAMQEQSKARERRQEQRERAHRRKMDGIVTPSKASKQKSETPKKRKAVSTAASLAGLTLRDEPSLPPSTPKRRKVGDMVLPPTPASTPKLKIRLPKLVPEVIIPKRKPFQRSSSQSRSSSCSLSSPSETLSPFATGRPPPTPDKSPPRSQRTDSSSEFDDEMDQDELETIYSSRRDSSRLDISQGPSHPAYIRPPSRWEESFIRTQA